MAVEEEVLVCNEALLLEEIVDRVLDVDGVRVLAAALGDGRLGLRNAQ